MSHGITDSSNLIDFSLHFVHRNFKVTRIIDACTILKKNFSSDHSRDVFRTLLNIYDEDFFREKTSS